MKKSLIYSKNKQLLGALFIILSVAYPLIVYYLAKYISSSYFVLGITALLLIRATLPFLKKRRPLQTAEKNTIYLSLMVAIAMLFLCLWNSQIAPLFYPVLMSLGLALLMGFTLLYPPSMIERLARIMEPNMDSSGVSYTRKVTIVWMMFGFINAALAGITILIHDRTIWMLYNGFISYILMGLLMAGEYIVRRHHKDKAKHSQPK